MPKNSSPYRKPPVKRTIDSFIDDKNLVERPRIDLGQARHTQIRRDKDKTKSIGITLYDIDFAVKSFIDNVMLLTVDDNGESTKVPTLYANSEKWASIQRNGYLKDKKGKTLVPLISFRRSGVNMKSEMRRNKVATTNQIGYIIKQQYNKNSPYDKFSTLYGNSSKQVREYIVTPIPDYVDVTYDFIAWTEYQNQLNYIVEQFVYFTGQSFGERNSFKFSTNVESFAMEDNNTTGQDRVVRCSFQITVHGYLLPKSVGTEVTTKRIVGPNKISFGSESFKDVITPFNQNDAIYNSGQFRNINTDERERSEDLQRRLNDFRDNSLEKSADVYSTEND
jgi:hypothetical protein